MTTQYTPAERAHTCQACTLANAMKQCHACQFYTAPKLYIKIDAIFDGEMTYGYSLNYTDDVNQPYKDYKHFSSMERAAAWARLAPAGSVIIHANGNIETVTNNR